ncbi:hypothetical protein VaNZ11_003868 [Volvox africanus]|uniref:Uncharacterized protein n=1 Tax=Volvox africanus TaxID=51714 RepID=A0ABQ5RV17_9CHLO|nr:hypothetical protein VaNZ11_003868 [Volvox africanus]
MESASVPNEVTSVRPATGQSAKSPVLTLAWRETIRRIVHMLFQAVARFRRLLGLLPRLPRTALVAALRVPGSLAKLVRLLFSSRPARLLLAAVASIICITLQYHRPTIADVQLSSSISLLFGMIKLQGSLAVQLGPPESRQASQPQAEELRINCPKDLKESIVRFLESQAAANLVMQAQAPAGQPSPAETGEALQPPPQLEQQQQHLQWEEAERQLPLLGEAEVENASESEGRKPLGPGGYQDFAFRTAEIPDPLAADDPDYADGSAAAGATAADVVSYVSAGSGSGGFESCCSDTFSETTTTVAGRTTSSELAAAIRMASVEPQLLLPSTPPLGCSPLVKADVAAGCPDGGSRGERGGYASGQQQQMQLPQSRTLHNTAVLNSQGSFSEPAPPNRFDFLSPISYTALYRPRVAVLGSSHAEMPTHGSSSGFCGIPFEAGSITLEGSEAEPGVAGGLPAARAAAEGVHHGGSSSVSGALQKSPDSILGLRNLGLEGWAASSRRWESRHLDV